MFKKFLAIGLIFISVSSWAAEQQISLPQPDKQGGMSLMEAIAARKTIREFGTREIDSQDLSNILFAAFGVSHDGKRTIPTPMNKQELSVYVVKKDGVWLYDAEKNVLDFVSSEDILPFIALQDFVKDAPLTLIYTGKDPKNSLMNAGAAYQNVGLYCASRGLHNVVRGYIQRDKIASILGQKEDEVIVSQTIGWPKE